MDQREELPEYFVTDDRRRVTMPTYEALAQCQIIMVGENNVPGPTLIEPGEVFSTEAIPNHQWMPLNRAAGERYEQWLASLPAGSNGLSQAEITEAAYIMRPREGEAEIPHDQWWPAVLKMAAQLKDKRQGVLRVPQPAMPQRPGASTKPVMPFMTAGQNVPTEPGRAPLNGAELAAAQQASRQSGGAAPAQRTRPGRPQAPAMANANATDSPSQNAG